MNAKLVKPKAIKIILSDGVERELKFTLNALAELEDKYGTVDGAFEAMDKGSIKAVRFILWAGLAHGDFNLTEQQVGDLIDLSTVRGLMQDMSSALESHMGPDDGQVPKGIVLEPSFDNPDILPENKGATPGKLPN